MGSDWNLWQWLALAQHELLLFAGVFFLIGALDDIIIDLVWLWLKITGRQQTRKIDRTQFQRRKLHGRAAVFIPAWQEAEVIGDTLTHMLGAWPQRQLCLYLGVYRNDPATLEAAIKAARSDERMRIVIHDCDGPSTKADCLNRLYQAMRDDETRRGSDYSTVLFHDAEDLVDPAGLGLLDEAIGNGADFAQLPVEPLPQAGRDWLGSHYCEEFSESHGKAMVVRDALGAGLPAAGVGCAVSRGALEMLCRRRAKDHPFEPASLTEDYELGLAISDEGGSSRFVRARGEDDLLVATRAYFPSQLQQIVRQKTRWVNGIALHGWDRTGWGQGNIEGWMRARDRRGPLTALVLLLAYLLLALTLLLETVVALDLAQPVPLGPMTKLLIYVNLVFLGWRIGWRFAFTSRNYGVIEGLLAIARIPVANVIAIMAGWRAILAYARTLLGRSIVWDKTEHSNHPARIVLNRQDKSPIGSLAQ